MNKQLYSNKIQGNVFEKNKMLYISIVKDSYKIEKNVNMLCPKQLRKQRVTHRTL